MKYLILLVAFTVLPLRAAIDGTVVNRTTGKPQADTAVTLIRPGQGGMQTLASVKTAANGFFHFDQDVSGGPALLQAVHGGVNYNKMLTPGIPASGVEVGVWDATTKRSVAQVAQHMLVLQPSGSDLTVNETFLYRNSSNLTYNDPHGTFRFWAPEAARKGLMVTVRAPGGMPIQRPAEPANGAGVLAVSYPIKPGETEFGLSYKIPEPNPPVFSGKVVDSSGPTRLVAPPGVTLKGEGIVSLGQEPTTQASVYDVKGDTFQVTIEGTGLLAGNDAGAGGPSDEESGAPPIQQVRPHIYDQMLPILALVIVILGLGSWLLYRRGAV